MNKINPLITQRSKLRADKQSVLTDGSPTDGAKDDADLLELVSQLQQIDFAEDRGAPNSAFASKLCAASKANRPGSTYD